MDQNQNQRPTMTDVQRGFMRYLAQEPLSACQSAGERRGWRNANRAQGFAEVEQMRTKERNLS